MSSTFVRYEIVCVVDASVCKAVRDRLREIAGERLRLVEFEGPFSFSAKINLGAVHSRGKHLLLLNDDIEVTTPRWLERMVMYSEREEIGAIGGRLVWADGRLQHVGVDFEGGLPNHTYRGYSGDFPGYANAVLIARNCLTVTGACLMTRRDLFEELGGLTTVLPVNFNDVDYCLKVHHSGRRIVYDPDLILFHYESSTRDPEVNRWECEQLVDRWQHVAGVDPFGNPGLRHGLPRLTSRLNGARRRPRLPRPSPTPGKVA